MNYLSDLHFVSESWWRGLASGEDHDDEDSNEEESEDCAHHSSGHNDGVWPLGSRLVWDGAERETLSVAQTQRQHEEVQGTESNTAVNEVKLKIRSEVVIESCIKT